MNVKRIAIKSFMSHADTTLDFPERGLVLLTGPNGGGKCLPGFSVVHDPVVGPMPIERFVRERRGAMLGLRDWKVTSVPVSGWHSLGAKPCVRVVYVDGTHDVYAGEHPVLTATGFREAKSLTSDCAVAHAAVLPVVGVAFSIAEIELLAIAVADGCCVEGLKISASLPDKVDAVKRLIPAVFPGCAASHHGGGNWSPVTTAVGQERQQLILTLASELRALGVDVGAYIGKNTRRFFRGESAISREIMEEIEHDNCIDLWRYKSALHGSGAAKSWLSVHGLLGKKSAHKRLPEKIKRADILGVRAALAYLWMTDGYVSSKGKEVSYTSASAGLVDDIRLLLLRIRVHSTVRTKHVNGTPYYTLNLTADGAIRFAQEVAIPGSKGALLSSMVLKMHASQRNPNIGAIPFALWSRIVPSPKKASSWFSNKRGMSPRTLRRFGGPEEIASADVRWVGVASVQSVGDIECFDVTVDTSEHAYIAGSAVVHNSSIIEAISVGLWGKTLRGSDPWVAGCKGAVRVETRDGLWALRTRAPAGTKKLDWAPDASESKKYETPTKAQEALEEVIGPWDVWRRCSVFSSHDASHFTLATDGERKRLFEAILGIEKFDTALEKCRADLRIAEREKEGAERSVEVLGARLLSEQRRAVDARASLAAEPPAVDAAAPRVELARITKLIATADEDIRSAEADTRAAHRAGGEHAATLKHLRAALDRVRGSSCPACTQPIPAAMREKLAAEVAAAERAGDDASTNAAEQADVLHAHLEELREERRQLAERAIVLREKARTADEAVYRRARHEATIAQSDIAIENTQSLLGASGVARLQAERSVALLGACDRVLGLKGVRAHVLGAALSGLEAVANGWLERLAGPGLRLTLKPYAEKKAGGVSDAIALEVEGAGGGAGYKGGSGGERRRLDIALLLALSEVSAAAYGREPGLVAFDEVFDSLDEDGVEMAAEALHDLGRTRCVLVISHSAALAKALRPTVLWSVASGAVIQA